MCGESEHSSPILLLFSQQVHLQNEIFQIHEIQNILFQPGHHLTGFPLFGILLTTSVSYAHTYQKSTPKGICTLKVKFILYPETYQTQRMN